MASSNNMLIKRFLNNYKEELASVLIVSFDCADPLAFGQQ